MKQESLFITQGINQLHLRHIWKVPNGVPIFMLHGAIENGRIFYTQTGKGLACYLAEQGFDVYVADLRGRGQSTPKIDAKSTHGQLEAITEDIPAFLEYIVERSQQKVHLIAHSWGGVLLASCLVRYPDILAQVRSQTCFGTKRRVTVKSVEKLLKVNLFWNKVAPKVAKYQGFLDAKKHGFGADNETKKSLEQSIAWVKPGAWIDPEDNFNYQQAAENINWPPTWHFTGVNDRVLGHQQDVKLFINESSNHRAKFSVLSKSAGYGLDYDHINILTHKHAVADHFPELASWLETL
jgi:pimeloyl-ACP methyl ester carboxylesterase